jgi:hypothetical protein
MSDEKRTSVDFVKFLVAEAADVLVQVADAGTWKDVIEICFSECVSSLENDSDVYDDDCRREMRLDIIVRVLWELGEVFGERPPSLNFIERLEGDLAAHFESFGFEDAWHWERCDHQST